MTEEKFIKEIASLVGKHPSDSKPKIIDRKVFT